MSAGTPRTTRATSANSKKTRNIVEENEIVGAKGSTKPRISPSVIDHGFHTDKYKTHYSAWTPVINSASNSQVRQPWEVSCNSNFTVVYVISAECLNNQFEPFCIVRLQFHSLNFESTLVLIGTLLWFLFCFF